MAATADALLLRSDQFEIPDRNDDAAFQVSLRGAVGALQNLDAPRGGVMRLARRSGKGSYTVTGAPVKREES